MLLFLPCCTLQGGCPVCELLLLLLSLPPIPLGPLGSRHHVQLPLGVLGLSLPRHLPGLVLCLLWLDIFEELVFYGTSLILADVFL